MYTSGHIGMVWGSVGVGGGLKILDTGSVGSVSFQWRRERRHHQVLYGRHALPVAAGGRQSRLVWVGGGQSSAVAGGRGRLRGAERRVHGAS